MSEYEKIKADPTYQIPFTNTYMFELVMENKDICKGVLERILHKKIGEITYLDTEHRLTSNIDAKSIAMDVYIESEKTYYNIECQVKKDSFLPKRIRYYQSMIDKKIMDRGDDYVTLKPTYIIFLCLFDPFSDEMPISSFKMTRQEKPLGHDPFGINWILLNANNWQQEDDPAIRSLLQYLKDKHVETTDKLIKQINDEVLSINADVVRRKEIMGIMTLEEEYRMREIRARRDGLAEGEAAGKSEAEARNNALINKLLEQHRFKDLKRCAANEDFKESLYQEFGL